MYTMNNELDPATMFSFLELTPKRLRVYNWNPPIRVNIFLFVDIVEFTCFSEEIYVQLVPGITIFFLHFLSILLQQRIKKLQYSVIMNTGYHTEI